MKNTNSVAYLEYSFLFDPSASSTWSNLFDFENSLGKFFESNGLNAEVINSVKGYGGQKRIVFLTKKPQEPLPQPQPTTSSKTPADALKAISGPSNNVKTPGRVVTKIIKSTEKLTVPQQNFKRGRFDPRKGYLRRDR